ncbi:MAG: hypothetical protein ACPHQR_05420, partial [Candidatus Poseidoniaceae archaeon]
MRTALWLTLVMLGALALPVASAAPVALSDVLDCGEGDVRVDGDLFCKPAVGLASRFENQMAFRAFAD